MTATLSRSASALALALALAFPAAHADVPQPVNPTYPGTIVLNVDATNLSQQIFRMRMSIPVKPGPLTLLYPQWLPANHGPNGPITQLAGLKFTANGKPVEWTRDPVQVFAFHVTVPAGASTLEGEHQYLSPLDASQGRNTMTDDILGVQWISTTLYPAGYVARGVTVQANLKLPSGWQYATALETDARQGDDIRFKPSDLETLADSPLFAGRYYKQFDLDPGAKVPVRLNVFADTPESLEAKPEQIAAHRKLVQQAYKLYGSYHYEHYDFLLSLSDEFGGIGREHHQSSENGVKPGYFTDWAKSEAGRDLLPHEYTHSWDGKFRRPAGQDVPNFNTPLQNELLWVYEGQTQYWGNVLAARSGLVSMAGARDALAATAARYDSVTGRNWRAMQDTVNDPIMNARRPLGWANWQRSEDYYSEGQLIWLDVDTRLREMSGDKRSLNDFAHAFYSINNGSRQPAFYSFEDVVATLNKIQPYDWAAFLRAKLDGHGPGAPLDGLARRKAASSRRPAGRPGARRLEAGLHRHPDRPGQGRGRPQQGHRPELLAGLHRDRRRHHPQRDLGRRRFPCRPGGERLDRRGQQPRLQAGGAEERDQGRQGRQADPAAGQEGQRAAHGIARLPRRPALPAPGTHPGYQGPAGGDLLGAEVSTGYLNARARRPASMDDGFANP
jgi:predicted metalloprotease with PDZ domain